MIGRTLSHYKILSEISRGGRGIVYRALKSKLDREATFNVFPHEPVDQRLSKRRFYAYRKDGDRIASGWRKRRASSARREDESCP